VSVFVLQVMLDPLAKLLDVGADVTRSVQSSNKILKFNIYHVTFLLFTHVHSRSDLPTVVALPPNDRDLLKGKTYRYV